jgi:hypothetical protein
MLTVIFFPFTTTFYADSVENFAVFTLAFRLFALNNILAALSIFALSYYVFVAHTELSYSIPEHYKRKFFLRQFVSGKHVYFTRNTNLFHQ